MKIIPKRILLLLLTSLLLSSAFASESYVRGQILHFLDNPLHSKSEATSYEYFHDGLLIINNGKIVKVGPWQQLKDNVTDQNKLAWYQHGLIMPGFIDTHVHYPQLDMIAANSGGHLLQWLNKFTFPFEKRFKNKVYAKNTADFFLQELLRNGTTTAMVFATRYPDAIDALFMSAEKKQMRIISGLVLADRNLPPYLIGDPNTTYFQSQQLIKKWHEKPGTRLLYAITLRFAPTTTPALFKKIAQLKEENPTAYLYTHISENPQEVKWSNDLFHSKNYLAIYDQYHLLGERTLLAHGIYLSKGELERMHETKTSVAFCPTSNLFLGSGLFNYSLTDKMGVSVGLGTDVGAGTSFSLLQTLNDAYKVSQMQNHPFSAMQGFYLATLGGAKALHLQDKLGNFTPGKEADFIVLDIAGSTPLLKRRLTFAKTLDDKLFALMILGDDRSIEATYVNGKLVYKR